MPFTLYEIVLYFYLYAFLGWCAEVAFQGITFGRLVNRGFLNGPWCPIYGFGMLAVLLALTPIQNHLLLLFLGGMALATGLELVGGWALYKLFKARWWDYSDERYNLGGYICLRFSILWGLGTLLMVRVVHPALAALAALVPQRAGWWLLGIISAVFAVDLVYTAISTASFTRDIAELELLRKLLRAPSDSLSEKIGAAAIKADLRADEARLQALLAKSELAARTQEERASLEQAAAAMVNRGLDYKREWETRQAALVARLWKQRYIGLGRQLSAFRPLPGQEGDLTRELQRQLKEHHKP